MGEVFRARDDRLKREVAVKVLPVEPSSANAVARFEQEARVVAALTHPAILQIYDVGRAGDVSYIVMELLEGETLRIRLAEGSVPVSAAVDWARQIAEGLAAAHEKGVIHRDLKPENLFVTRDGRVKILDFGLAARREPAFSPAESQAPTMTVQTEPGTVLGTPGYMSPEQIRGEVADARSDIFSLGTVMYEMLSGRRPFQRDSVAETLVAILRDDPLRLTESGRNLPPGLVRLVLHCLEKKPDLRFQSARDLAFGLEAVLGGAGGFEDTATAPSIAVLPLADMSPQHDQDYFCEGMAEELIDALARIEGIRVASRTSSFQFKGTAADIAAIGERLRVRTVLEGSLRKAEDRLRITIQLVNVADGYHLWSGRFDRKLEDVFAIQEEIATQVVQALRVVLTESEKRKLARPRTARVEAYDFYLRGRQRFHRLTRADLAAARQFFDEAVDIDPEFAAAHAGISDVSAWLHLWWGGREEDLHRAEEAGMRALALDPELAEAHVAMGNVAFQRKNHAEAEREFRTAIRLNPRLYDTYNFFARLRVDQGKLEQAAELFEKAAAVQPEDYQAPLILGWIYKKLGREEDRNRILNRGLEAARQWLRLHPDDNRARYLGGGALISLGNTAEGLEWVRQALEKEPDEPAVLYNVACSYANVGDSEKALDYLEKAATGGWGDPDWMQQDEDLSPLRNEPRFQKLIEKMRSRNSAEAEGLKSPATG